MNTLMKKAQIFKLGKSPVVVLPVRTWDKMRMKFEEMKEYLEMYNSASYRKSIARARKSKKLYTPEEVYKKLGL